MIDFPIYTVYSEDGDITFIMQDTYETEVDPFTGEVGETSLLSTECKGCYSGKPDQAKTQRHIGNYYAYIIK